jgi:hypothetical protein
VQKKLYDLPRMNTNVREQHQMIGGKGESGEKCEISGALFSQLLFLIRENSCQFVAKKDSNFYP